MSNTGVWFALGAAALFGMSTPLVEPLLGSMPPASLAFHIGAIDLV